jgi:hypothetical protein
MVVVPVGVATASTGITVSPYTASLLGLLPYIKIKTYKTSSNSRREGKVEICPKMLTALRFFPPKFSKTRTDRAGGNPKIGPGSRVATYFYTPSTGAPQGGERKNGPMRGKVSRSSVSSA